MYKLLNPPNFIKKFAQGYANTKIIIFFLNFVIFPIKYGSLQAGISIQYKTAMRTLSCFVNFLRNTRATRG